MSKVCKELEGKSQEEKVNIKSEKISELSKLEKVKHGNYWIEVFSINKIKGGIEVLVRAWDGNGQIGFGKDGTVDLERFVIINPPILVSDPKGDIVRAFKNHRGEIEEYRLREDLKEALLQTLEHTIKVKKQKSGSEKIVQGKIGNTTLTAFPNAGTGTAPIDGRGGRSVVNEIFATIRDGAGTFSVDTDATVDNPRLIASTTTNQFETIDRGGYGFGTSSIGGNTINSAIFSLFDANVVLTGLGDTDVDVVSFTPADGSDFANSDFEAADFGTTRFATGKALSTFTGSAYNDWTLNASGRAAINTGGNTFFGTRLKWDVDNSFTGTWVSSEQSSARFRQADIAGTGNDPKLVVEHSAAAVVNTPTLLLLGIG